MSGRITIRKARIITSREAAQAHLSADDARLLAAAPALLVAEAAYSMAVIVQCRCDAVLRQYGSR